MELGKEKIDTHLPAQLQKEFSGNPIVALWAKQATDSFRFVLPRGTEISVTRHRSPKGDYTDVVLNGRHQTVHVHFSPAGGGARGTPSLAAHAFHIIIKVSQKKWRFLVPKAPAYIRWAARLAERTAEIFQREGLPEVGARGWIGPTSEDSSAQAGI